MMVLAACEYGQDGNFQKLVNPTGRFVLGGSYADCGVTGRKLACDTYGGIGRMGGGALTGKDPTKVDRSAAYMARKIAKDIVQAGYADKCEVQLAYAIGVVQPVGVAVECFGTEHQPLDFIQAYVKDSYDLTPQGIIQRLGLLDVDYNKVSAYGHFGKPGLSHATFSNIEYQSLNFVMHSLTPWLVRIEQGIIKDLLLEEEQDTYFPKFNVDGLLRGDYQSRMNGYATGISNGFLSPNDIHRLENMDLIPADQGGDDYYLNGGYVKLKDAGLAQQKPLGLLAETGGAKVGVKAAKQDAVTFDEIFKLYYALKAPYRKKAQFLCNEALVLQLMTIKDNNGNYIWKPGLEIGKPDTLLNRPLKTSAFMPEIKGGNKVMAFGDYSYYWVADRQNRTFRRLNELYARTDQVGFLTTQRVDGKLILPESVQLLQMAAGG